MARRHKKGRHSRTINFYAFEGQMKFLPLFWYKKVSPWNFSLRANAPLKIIVLKLGVSAKNQDRPYGLAWFFMLRGTWSLRGRRALKKRLISVFSEAGARRAPKRKRFGRRAGRVRSTIVPSAAPKKNRNFDTKLRFCFFARKALYQGISQKRKVPL